MKDPTVTTPNITLTVAPGGAIVGKYISTDSARGVFKAPAGLDTRIAGAVSVAQLTNTELDTLNSTVPPVNAIRFIPGSGIVVMGARTLRGSYSDRYVSIRRTLIYLRKALTDLTEFAVFEPNDQRLWRQLTGVTSGFLTEFWNQGGLRGDTPEQAYFVKCDDETNTLASIDNGEVRLEIGVALQRPAEFVIIKIGQFDGGTTVTVE
jgi:phage tail sheath protein FI